MNNSSLPRAFVDTNIWLYAFIEADDRQKNERARQILMNCQPVVSIQIINEVCVNLIRKAAFSEEKIAQLILAFFAAYDIAETNQETLLLASDLRSGYSLSFWDSLVIANALETEVDTLYSEDFQHQQKN